MYCIIITTTIIIIIIHQCFNQGGSSHGRAFSNFLSLHQYISSASVHSFLILFCYIIPYLAPHLVFVFPSNPFSENFSFSFLKEYRYHSLMINVHLVLPWTKVSFDVPTSNLVYCSGFRSCPVLYIS